MLREKEVSVKDESTHTPSVGNGVVEKEVPESKPMHIELEDRIIPPPPLSPKPIPFLSRLEEKKKWDKQEFGDFFKMFKALNVNIPLLELIEKMPKYAKFLKDEEIERGEQIALNEKRNVIVSRRVTPKLKDQGNFTIPIEIAGASFGKALCDLGAKTNLIQLSIYRRLGLGELKETERVLEDVLVRVRQFIFPVDFIMLDFEENLEIFILLRRLFLATSKATIDVGRGELTMDIEGETKVFKCVELESKYKEVLIS
ncbi:DNA damage-inducible protein 1-like [Gossypium australe]|uniref:DNA damage-inducible protein 1-like n=1 Tax=Gossypium australe TaxID=47621 RepID=A0A5B6WF48_9ROSI|nr:DNA damage-inducible protein 1-like [Gossypium australe]